MLRTGKVFSSGDTGSELVMCLVIWLLLEVDVPFCEGTAGQMEEDQQVLRKLSTSNSTWKFCLVAVSDARELLGSTEKCYCSFQLYCLQWKIWFLAEESFFLVQVLQGQICPSDCLGTGEHGRRIQREQRSNKQELVPRTWDPYYFMPSFFSVQMRSKSRFADCSPNLSFKSCFTTSEGDTLPFLKGNRNVKAFSWKLPNEMSMTEVLMPSCSSACTLYSHTDASDFPCPLFCI